MYYVVQYVATCFCSLTREAYIEIYQPRHGSANMCLNLNPMGPGRITVVKRVPVSLRGLIMMLVAQPSRYSDFG